MRLGRNPQQYLLLSVIILSGSATGAFSGPLKNDTIILTLKKAEGMFLENNVQLLAQKCNIDAARALVLQERLWDNPTVSANQNVYNTDYSENGASRWFPLSDKGETSVQVQQIISIAGKRNKRIKLAELTAKKNEYLYYDLLRTLKYQLRSDFYKICFTQQVLSVYTMEIESIAKLIRAFDEQYTKGQVSKKDLLRLKASLFSLENERLPLDNQLVDARADLALLLRLDHACPVAQADPRSLDSISLRNVNEKDLIDTALLYRNDLKAAEADVNYSTLNAEYQKSLAIPDFQFVAGWDKNGSYVHNYNYCGILIDLPVFNRNQGNIKAAITSCQYSRYNYRMANDQVISDVSGALSKALQDDTLYKKLDRNFVADFSSLQDEMAVNYAKRNISLLEFLDFYDAYKQNAVQYITLQNNRVDAFEGVNFSVGKNIIALNDEPVTR